MPTSPERRTQLIQIVKDLGHRQLDEPVQLASGDLSRHFIDAKRALALGSNLRLACEALTENVGAAGIDYNAVGGLTLGADQFAHGIAMVAGDVEWFTVRKQAKDRGTRQRVEGAVLGAGSRVLLVDDVVTRGGSIVDALDAIRETGAEVVGAVALVDRGRRGREIFAEVGIPYLPLLTYEDIGIPEVGTEGVAATAH